MNASLSNKDFTVRHLLSFVTNQDGNMLTIHVDGDGLSLLIEKLLVLKGLLDSGQCEHTHLFTSDSIGEELSNTKFESVPEESTIVQHVKINCWTREWAEIHRLVPQYQTTQFEPQISEQRDGREGLDRPL